MSVRKSRRARREASESPRRSKPKSRAARGRRYSAEEKARILERAERLGVKKAASGSGATVWSIYRWRKEASQLSENGASDETTEGVDTSAPARKAIRLRIPPRMQNQIVEVWRNNPGFGPDQVSRQLRRVGVRCDTKTVRKVLRAHGYTPPAKKPPRPRASKRFEASRPLELVQMDVLHFWVHGEKLYLFFVLDDHSRFVTGWGIGQRETMDIAIEVVEESIRRYGKPEAILTDRGAIFHAWRGVGEFDRFLESYEIEHRLAAAEHPQTCGKVEALNGSIQKELLNRVEFQGFLDAKSQIAAWIDRYNHQRCHSGIGGVLVPADRFFGRADQVLARIEANVGGKQPQDPVPPEIRTDDSQRSVSLFHAQLVEGSIELWLFGRLVARLSGDETGE